MDKEMGKTHVATKKNSVLEIKSPWLSYIYAPTSLKINPTMKRTTEKARSPLIFEQLYFLLTRRVSSIRYVSGKEEEWKR